jgi:hypothetical protein
MKTEELISALATGRESVDRRAPRRAGALALGGGALLAGALMFVWLGLNPALRAFLAEPMFWVKLGFGLALALSSLWLVAGLAQPGVRVSFRSWLPLAPVAVLWALGAAALIFSAPEARAALIWGQTWRNCLVAIPTLSVPTLAGALLVLRRMAPTCPACAGAAAGALASGVGSAIYALHCPELAAPFLALWYVIGTAIPVLAGAMLGHRLLRW